MPVSEPLFSEEIGLFCHASRSLLPLTHTSLRQPRHYPPSISRRLVYVTRFLFHIIRSLSHIARSLSHITRSRLHIIRSLLHINRSLLHVCIILLQPPRVAPRPFRSPLAPCVARAVAAAEGGAVFAARDIVECDVQECCYLPC